MRGNLALRAVPPPIQSGDPDDETGEEMAPSSGSGGPGAGALRAGDTGAEAPAIRRGRLLIIDDEVVFSGSLRRLFSNEHDVTVVNRGTEALGRLRAGERFDAILCDLLMPEVTGVELYTELRQIAPDQANCMIFLTGGAFSESSQRFLDGVSNRWFEKPCNLDLLRAAVREVVVRNRSR
ncbi:MAG TPA: response regulator [Kofleriaceae bacterium]